MGRVWQVSPVVDPENRLGMARIALGYQKAIRPGGFASVSIVSGTPQAPLLTESAWQSDEKGNYVYVINRQNEAERRDVTAGQEFSDVVAHPKGLHGREHVVLSSGTFPPTRPQVMDPRQKD